MSPPIHLASLRMVTFVASLGGLKRKWQDPRGLVWQCRAVAVCDHPLNSQSGGLRRLASTFSQVGSVPTSAKESIGDGYKWISMEKMQLWQAHLFLNFLAWAFAPKLYELIQSFNSWPLFLCQWLPY